jgi:hypothetical protein
MKCVACAALPHAPVSPKAAERSRRPHRRLACLIGSPGQNLLLPIRDRWRNPAAGPMDGRPGQAIVVKLVCRGACREFSDYDFEGLGGPSRWARLRRRTDALCQYPDVKRIGLDRPDAAIGRARTKARNLCRLICAAGRSRLVHHGFGQTVPGFAGSADPRPRRKAAATV